MTYWKTIDTFRVSSNVFAVQQEYTTSSETGEEIPVFPGGEEQNRVIQIGNIDGSAPGYPGRGLP